MRAAAVCAFGVTLVASMIVASAQRGGTFVGSRDNPAIHYSTGATSDPVSTLAAQIKGGKAHLAFDPDNGYLRSVLDALRIPVESQVTVFSATSNQAALINPRNPRALYFNDSVAVGWVRGSDELEVASVDPARGVILYSLEQKQTERPAFKRDDETCLTCHLTWDTLGVPGLVVMSVFTVPAPDDKYSYASGQFADQRTSFPERWGGWYVTGKTGAVSHLGNDTNLAQKNRKPSNAHKLDSLAGLFDPRGFLSPHSDVVALMTLEHQATMTNLITRTGWEARISAQPPTVTPPQPPGTLPRAMSSTSPAPQSGAERVRDAATELVDYLLFVDEAPLADRIQGSSAFTRRFAAMGARDAKGRSLHELDLTRRLLKYPCSYEIYSDAFDALPPAAKAPIYRRMWQVLSGEERGDRYRSALSLVDRRAIVEILKDTKRDLPAYFQSVSR
jgi:hypothetical protein